MEKTQGWTKAARGGKGDNKKADDEFGMIVSGKYHSFSLPQFPVSVSFIVAMSHSHGVVNPVDEVIDVKSTNTDNKIIFCVSWMNSETSAQTVWCVCWALHKQMTVDFHAIDAQI